MSPKCDNGLIVLRKSPIHLVFKLIQASMDSIALEEGVTKHARHSYYGGLHAIGETRHREIDEAVEPCFDSRRPRSSHVVLICRFIARP